MLIVAPFEVRACRGEAKNSVSTSLGSAEFRGCQQMEVQPEPRDLVSCCGFWKARSATNVEKQRETLMQTPSLVKGLPYLRNEPCLEVCKGPGTHYCSGGLFCN